MLRSPRTLAVILLWLVAVWPLALLALGWLDPAAGVRVAGVATHGAGWLLWGACLVSVLVAFLYPPFVPALRLRMQGARRRLGTPDKPVRDAYARLEQLETVNDQFAVGRFLRERGQPAAAVKHLLRAVQLEASHTSARYQLALAYRDANNAQGAVDELQRVLAADPQLASGQPFLDLAELFERARLPAPADAVLTQYRRLHGDTRVALVLHARALAALGRRDESVQLLRQAAAPPAPGVRISPADAHARARARVAMWFGGFR